MRYLLALALAGCEGVVSQVTGHVPEDCCELWPDTDAIRECVEYTIDTPRTCVTLACYPNEVTACTDAEP